MPTTRFWGQTVPFRYIHIKTSVPRFDFETCSAHIYSMTLLPFEVFNNSCIAVLVFPSPTVRPLEIIIKTFLIPFNVFKTFYGLKFAKKLNWKLRTCGSPVFKVACRAGQWYILVARLETQYPRVGVGDMTKILYHDMTNSISR